jgi:hypothetical protein
MRKILKMILFNHNVINKNTMIFFQVKTNHNNKIIINLIFKIQMNQCNQ